MSRTPISLVVTEEDRRRVREVEQAVTSARKISFWSVAAIVPFMVDGHGLVLVIGLVLFAVHSAIVDWRYRRSEHPALWMFSLTMATQAWVTLISILTGGPTSPAMIFLVISMVSMPARYGTRGMIVGTAISGVCLVAVALSQGVDAFVAAPDLALVTAASCVACLAYGNALRQSEVSQRQAAILDPLTGLLNRSHMDERFAEIREVAIARGRSLGVLVLDIDHFKHINDRYGHAHGDAVLVDTAYALRAALDEFELLYRYGGEEFVVFLPGTDLVAATHIAERLRAGVRAARPGGIDVTISVGVAVAAGEEIDLRTQMAVADAALYQAKRGGRNRVIAEQLGAAVDAPLADERLAA